MRMVGVLMGMERMGRGLDTSVVGLGKLVRTEPIGLNSLHRQSEGAEWSGVGRYPERKEIQKGMFSKNGKDS